VERCKIDRSPSKQTYPCIIKHTIFHTEPEYREYRILKLAQRVPEPKRIQRKRRLKLAQQEAAREANKLKQKQPTKRRVQFVI
jgi:hypothetical protein